MPKTTVSRSGSTLSQAMQFSKAKSTGSSLHVDTALDYLPSLPTKRSLSTSPDFPRKDRKVDTSSRSPSETSSSASSSRHPDASRAVDDAKSEPMELDAKGAPSLKYKLDPSVTYAHMPFLKDRRTGHYVPMRASVMLTAEPYLMSSASDLSGSFGKLHAGLQLNSGITKFIKRVRLEEPKEGTKEKTRAGRSQTVFIGDKTLPFLEAERAMAFGAVESFFVDNDPTRVGKHALYLVMDDTGIGLDTVEFFGIGRENRQAVCRTLAKELFDGLSFMHEGGAIHNDLKFANITYKRDQARFQLIDFGLTETLDKATGESVQASSSYGTYPPPNRFDNGVAVKKASPYDDTWAIASLVMHAVSAMHAPAFDPFYFKQVIPASQRDAVLNRVNAFDKWFANMRASDKDDFDLSPFSDAIFDEERVTVRALHEFGNAAAQVDKDLMFFLWTNVMDLAVGPKHSAKALGQMMETQMTADGDALWNFSHMQRAHNALFAGLDYSLSDEMDQLKNGLRALSQSSRAQQQISLFREQHHVRLAAAQKEAAAREAVRRESVPSSIDVPMKDRSESPEGK